MKIIGLIPARLESTRFPNKLLQPLGNSTVIACTYSNVIASNLFDEVYVVTDSEKIETSIQAIGGNVLRNKIEHPSGTDRIAEFATLFSDEDILINIQGDEPLLAHEMLYELIELMKEKKTDNCVGTLMQQISDKNDIANPNFVKVVASNDGRALFFSRSIIPFNRDNVRNVKYFRHIGIYAFTKKSLELFTSSPVSHLESIEKLENLRFLELGIPVFIRETKYTSIGIDTEEDWRKACAIFDKK